MKKGHVTENQPMTVPVLLSESLGIYILNLWLCSVLPVEQNLVYVKQCSIQRSRAEYIYYIVQSPDEKQNNGFLP